MPNYTDVSKNNNAFRPLQSGRKSLENDVYFSKLYVIRVDKATQTYQQNASLNIVDSWPNSWKIPVSNIRPCRAGSCQTVHPWKKSPHFLLTHLLCFIFSFFPRRRAAQWFVTGSSQQSEAAFTSPRSAVPHTALHPPTKYFITLPVFFFHLFDDTWLIFICMMPSLVFCFFSFWSGELKRAQRPTGGGSVILAPRRNSRCVDSSIRWVMAILFSCVMNKVPLELRWRVITFKIFQGRLCILCSVWFYMIVQGRAGPEWSPQSTQQHLHCPNKVFIVFYPFNYGGDLALLTSK